MSQSYIILILHFIRLDKLSVNIIFKITILIQISVLIYTELSFLSMFYNFFEDGYKFK